MRIPALKFIFCALLIVGLLPAVSPALAADIPDAVQYEYLLWTSAEKSGSSQEYKIYLEQFPDGICSDLAQKRVTEAAAWDGAKDPGNNLGALEAYLHALSESFGEAAIKDFRGPSGPALQGHNGTQPVPEAVQLKALRAKFLSLEKCDVHRFGARYEYVLWTSAEESGSSQQYKGYLEQFPDGICSDLARKRVPETVAWEEVKSSYNAYVIESYLRTNLPTRFAKIALDQLKHVIMGGSTGDSGTAFVKAEKIAQEIRRKLPPLEECDTARFFDTQNQEPVVAAVADHAEEKRIAEEAQIAEEREATARQDAILQDLKRREAAAMPIAEMGQRLALVIGNGEYMSAPLINPTNDSTLMAQTLTDLGFLVSHRNNVTQSEMKRAILDFGIKLEDMGPDTIGLFYYAGHGMQVDGTNYLLPVDVDIRREADVAVLAVAADDVISQMKYARNPLNIVILDACRNNPYTRSFRNAVGGLARMEAPRGTMIAYSTRPGDVAADGFGEYSPYTEALVAAMQIPGLSLSDLFIQARVSVMRATDDQQVPWEEGGLTARFYSNPPTEPAIKAVLEEPEPRAATVPNDANETLFWETVKDSDNRAMLEAYLLTYPNGTFAGLARVMIQQLTGE